MKRDIRFRAWTGSKMEYNIMAGFLGAFYVKGIDDNDAACMSPFNTIYDSETPVMQFTGLIDKNGKEIYEGDLLKGGIYLSYDVRWDYEEVGWNISEHVQFHYEVIGNIHENPELI